MGKDGTRRFGGWSLAAVAVAAGLIALLPTLASAHIERASYWPDPGPDTSVTPPAGGAVPGYRPLFTALDRGARGRTRVVCLGKVPRRPAAKLKRARANLRGRALKRRVKRIKRTYNRRLNRNRSIRRLRGAVKRARRHGYRLRPHGRRLTLGSRAARRRIAFNKRLLAACGFRSIQAAVNASRNNDRVVIMPGVYTEPRSRAAPTDDPRCDGLEELNDRGQTGALSYAYQYTCPNDQNLIAVMGRVPNHGAVPQPPRDDRRGIPDEGACIRCNLQLEGSGVSADDVVIDAGRVASGNGGPADSVKDVTIRADRADGFVLRNLTARHAAEHDIYVPETDGARLERFKTFYNGEYGVLTFVADHHLIQDCEAVGSGDAGLYPGSSAEVGEETTEPAERFSTEIRRCDMHHNVLGYSGTAANAVHVHDNNFYDNALGFSTDVFTAAGHPGFPQDSDLIERNNFFSNNFNPFEEGSDVEPTVPAAVGTAMWIAGGNNNTVRDNRIWDNWRRGVMVFAVPDAFVCGPTTGNAQHGCDPAQISTSHRNRLHGNVMGRRPDGEPDPNGTDFWWDQFLGNTGNCWYDNIGHDGTANSVTSEPPAPLLPSNCQLSIGTIGPVQEAELVGCLAAIEFDVEGCPWYATPPEPQP
jgi:hypothetical protein